MTQQVMQQNVEDLIITMQMLQLLVNLNESKLKLAYGVKQIFDSRLIQNYSSKTCSCLYNPVNLHSSIYTRSPG